VAAILPYLALLSFRGMDVVEVSPPNDVAELPRSPRQPSLGNTSRASRLA